jgi:hypothetical protein
VSPQKRASVAFGSAVILLLLSEMISDVAISKRYYRFGRAGHALIEYINSGTPGVLQGVYDFG